MFGLVYAPALADFYVTLAAGRGGQRRGSSRQPSVAQPGRLRPARRSARRVPDPNALAALTSQSHLNRATQRFLDGYNVIERRAVASSLKFGLIAKGEADLYPRVGPTSEWDTAAGHAVLAAAGRHGDDARRRAAALRQCRRGFVNPGLRGLGARAAAEDDAVDDDYTSREAKRRFRPHFGNTLRQLLVNGAHLAALHVGWARGIGRTQPKG